MTPILGIMASAISGHLGLSVDYLVVAGGVAAARKSVAAAEQVDCVQQ
jgi:hypothetical protein